MLNQKFMNHLAKLESIAPASDRKALAQIRGEYTRLAMMEAAEQVELPQEVKDAAKTITDAIRKDPKIKGAVLAALKDASKEGVKLAKDDADDAVIQAAQDKDAEAQAKNKDIIEKIKQVYGVNDEQAAVALKKSGLKATGAGLMDKAKAGIAAMKKDVRASGGILGKLKEILGNKATEGKSAEEAKATMEAINAMNADQLLVLCEAYGISAKALF